MNTLYKILFEVKILHEFYLTDKNGNNIFSIPAQADRINFLKERAASNEENINSDLDFKIPLQTQQLFQNHKLKLFPAYAGFQIAVAVIETENPDGSSTYTPKINLPEDFSIPVLIAKKGGFLKHFTNGKLEHNLPAAYCFSNESSLTASLGFPFLTTDVAAFDPAVLYEQGELAKFASNDFRQFYRDDTEAAQWSQIQGNAFANEHDRLILPFHFYYTFPKDSAVTEVTFILTDSDGAVIESINYSNDLPFNKIPLSINQDKVRALPEAVANEKLVYTLTVNGSGGFSRTHRIIFYQDGKEITESFGLILIKLRTTDPAIQLLDDSGKLVATKQADGTYNPAAPIFEINIKSKPSFWRYINNSRKNLKAGLHANLLIAKNGALVSRTPRVLTYTSTLFRKPDNTFYYLPNPKPYQPVIFEQNKLYSDIIVPESTLFPIAP